MLTYTPQSQLPAIPQKNQDKPWLLILLCLFWLIPGLVGHDPWKPQENENMALIAHLLRSDHWVITWLADKPFLDTAPLYYWCAALLANALAWFGVTAHDAARLSTGLWMALAFWGSGLAGRELFGHRFGRLVVVLQLGSLGLLLWGHHIAPAALAFAAYAWGLYALIVALKKPLLAGALLGVSLLLLLLGATWADGLLLGLIAVSLLAFPDWRKPGYLVTLLTALVIALPLAALWGYALHTESREIFQLWWRQYAWGPYGGADAVVWLHEPGFLLSTLLWFAWPVLPLALWAIWINRAELLLKTQWQLLLWLLAVFTAYIVLSGQPNEVIVLPLLLVLSLAASAGIDDLRRGAASALNWFSVLTFGFTALGMWLVWLLLITGSASDLLPKVARHSSMALQFQPVGVIFAVVVSLLWGGVLLRPRAIGRKASTNWACGVILVLGLFVGLFQAWVDTGKSYRPVGAQLNRLAQVAHAECISVQGMPQAPLGALVYFTDVPLRTTRLDCPILIQLGGMPGPQGSVLLGQLQRLGESREVFMVYQQ